MNKTIFGSMALGLFVTFGSLQAFADCIAGSKSMTDNACYGFATQEQCTSGAGGTSCKWDPKRTGAYQPPEATSVVNQNSSVDTRKRAGDSSSTSASSAAASSPGRTEPLNVGSKAVQSSTVAPSSPGQADPVAAASKTDIPPTSLQKVATEESPAATQGAKYFHCSNGDRFAVVFEKQGCHAQSSGCSYYAFCSAKYIPNANSIFKGQVDACRAEKPVKGQGSKLKDCFQEYVQMNEIHKSKLVYNDKNSLNPKMNDYVIGNAGAEIDANCKSLAITYHCKKNDSESLTATQLDCLRDISEGRALIECQQTIQKADQDYGKSKTSNGRNGTLGTQ